MTKTFAAIFENGVFRPVEPVDLPQYCQVMVEVRTIDSAEEHIGPDECSTRAPMSQRVRIVGRLWATPTSPGSFKVVLDDGQQIATKMAASHNAIVAGFLNQRVLVLGTAVYDSSGGLLRIDADDVSLAADEGRFFSSAPQPIHDRFDVEGAFRDQRHKPGLSAIVGMWPGDESDDEVVASLKELS